MNDTRRIFVGDFETTVYEGQTNTEVWASAVVELNTEYVQIFHSIADTFDYLTKLDNDIVIYYHNLKFDGSFWIDYFLRTLHLEQAFQKYGENDLDYEPIRTTDMKDKTFKYSISDMGAWYSITIKWNGHIIEIRDSLKLLPFSVRKIGKSFGTKHKKLDMEYTGFRFAGCEITEEEKKYIANDVLVVKEALEIMFAQGHDKLTIGSCCLSEYKKIEGKYDYEMFFPNVANIQLDKEQYGSSTVDEYIRKSYKGGWCYLVKGKENQIKKNGTTADVNSLYPSMMSSESGNAFPVGKPKFWKGNFIPVEALAPNKYFFVRIRTRFYIKPNKLPFIQIKNSILYKSTEALETSDIKNPRTGKYSKYYIDLDGQRKPAIVELTLTMTDYILMRDQYNLVDFEILDGCYFYSVVGIFDEYIERYKKIKLESTGALRELAKLFLNNLYGKLATNPRTASKYAVMKEDGNITFVTLTPQEKDPVYIPAGSAITSYARNFTIRAAQANYYGKNERGFIYADTDSIHCDLLPEEIKGIKVHDRNFCCWKLESCWDVATFTRQKTYIEHVTHENLEPVAEPYYNVKCAGMPDKCKKLFERSMAGDLPRPDEDLTPEEREFLSVKRELSDFTIGLKVPGKLVPKRIKGGVLLRETTYEMR